MQNRDRVVSKDDLIAVVWGGRIVSDSTLTSRINAARKAVGDSGERAAPDPHHRAQGLPLRRRRSTSTRSRDDAALAPTCVARHPPQQEVHFCTASDGVRIAYASAGQGSAAGQGRQLAQPSRIRLAQPDLEPPAARARRGASADPLRRARQRPVGLGRRRHLVRSLRARSRKRGRRRRPRPISAARHFAGLRGLDRLCGAPSRARRAIWCSMADLRAGAQRGSEQQIPSRPMPLLTLMRQGWGRRTRHSGSSSRRCSFRAAPPSRCSGSTTCSASPRRRRMRSGSAARGRIDIDVTDLLPQVRVSDAGPALPQRRGAAVRGGPPACGRHSGRALRGARRPQPPHSGKRARLGAASLTRSRPF